jgi:uncharacterized protein YjbI with pentapeptide repeats
MNSSLMFNEYKRKTVTVEVLHLDALGYGPEGKHTRLQWRAECLEYLLKGKQAFIDWQNSWLEKAKQNTNRVDFTIRVTTSDNGVTNSFEVTDKTNPCALDFSGQKFENPLHLEGFHFLHEAIFSYARFEMHTYFYDVIFKDRSTFKGVVFQLVYFDRASFRGGVDFSEAVFIGGVSNFIEVKFKSGSNFNSVTFFSKAVFRKAIFKSHASFHNAKFIDSAYFENALFRSAVYFTDARFFSIANFEKVEFTFVGHFENVQFHSCPLFFGVKDSTRLHFSENLSFTNQDFHHEYFINGIGFLKRLAEANGQIEQALNFNAMELRAKRKSAWQQLQADEFVLKIFGIWPWRFLVKIGHIFNGNFWFCVFTYLYEGISDFGRSFTRPLFYLILLFFASYLFGVVSAVEHSPSLRTHTRQPVFSELSRVYSYDNVQISLSGYRAATEYGLYRSGNFLDFTDADKNTKSVNMRLFGQEIEPGWARLFGIFKGIITTVLLFLTALGLRNKYRVG